MNNETTEISTEKYIFLISEIDFSRIYNYKINYKSKRSKKWSTEFIKTFEDGLKFIERYSIMEFNEKQRKEQIKQYSKLSRESVCVGDIFNTSWGYDQTNIEFFIVLEKKTATKVLIQEIGKITVPGSDAFMSRYVIPDKLNLVGEPRICQIDVHGNISNIDRYGNKGRKTSETAKHYESWRH